MSGELLGIILVALSVNLVRVFTFFLNDSEGRHFTTLLTYIIITIADVGLIKVFLIGLKLIIQSW